MDDSIPCYCSSSLARAFAFINTINYYLYVQCVDCCWLIHGKDFFDASFLQRVTFLFCAKSSSYHHRVAHKLFRYTVLLPNRYSISDELTYNVRSRVFNIEYNFKNLEVSRNFVIQHICITIITGTTFKNYLFYFIYLACVKSSVPGHYRFIFSSC